jgi:serine/threonine protein kinase
MEHLEGVSLERYLQLRRRRLFPDEAMFIAASLADALLVVHSLNTLHCDINARSIFLCTDGTVKLTDFGATKASLRARREIDDSEPWVDISAIARTLYEAMTGQAVFDDEIQPHANVPPQMFGLFSQMLAFNGQRRISTMFEYRHALACVEVGAVYPDVTMEDVRSTVPEIRKPEARIRPQVSQAAQQTVEPEQKRTILDRALDAMENAVTTEKRVADERKAESERRIKKKVGILYAGILAVVLILALILRGLIH